MKGTGGKKKEKDIQKEIKRLRLVKRDMKKEKKIDRSVDCFTKK